MWNKIFICTLLFCGWCFQISAQEYLGQDRNAILKFVETNNYRISNLTTGVDSIKFVFEEEDERNRTFIVQYSFQLQDDICIAYKKEMPQHEYWVNTFLDFVNLRKAQPSGTKVDIDGVNINSQYALESCVVTIEKGKENFTILYKQKE